jgi:hypothetical protein
MLTGYSAPKMAMAFSGAAALEQAFDGHYNISSPSLCTAEFVSSYFKSGKLPDKGTVCQVDQLLFQWEIKTAEQLGSSGEDAKIWERIKEIN